ncbi:hypothetical protein FB157_106248 [Streptomyces sp. BK340]|nr:hypothetical protein FB157_106248 [Streptomyces sp. BK340]
MSSDLDRDLLSALWQRQYSKGSPIAHELRTAYGDRWVRFHSLPGSKRYPETEDESHRGATGHSPIESWHQQYLDKTRQATAARAGRGSS